MNLCPGYRTRIRVAALLLAAALSAVTTPAAAAPDKREMQARQAFAAGRYDEALELFAKLYAETLHPTYLRNIGRCHQNLGDPDKAIINFREYLRKTKKVSPAERAEVEGFIAEMEALKREKEAAAAKPPDPPPTKPDPGPSNPPPDLKPTPTSGPTVVVTSGGTSAPAESSRPFYGRWWFWTAVGVVVAGATVALVAGGAFSSSKSDPPCTNRICQ